MDMAVI